MDYLIKYRIYNNETNELCSWLYKHCIDKEHAISFLDDIRKDNKGEFKIYKYEHFIIDDVFDIL